MKYKRVPSTVIQRECKENKKSYYKKSFKKLCSHANQGRLRKQMLSFTNFIQPELNEPSWLFFKTSKSPTRRILQ